MGSASVSIKIIGSYNGSAVEKARQSLEKLNATAAAASGGAAQSWVEAGTAAMEYGAKIENVGYKIESAGRSLAAISATVIAVGAICVAKAVEIDTALTGVKKTVDATDAEYQQLKESAIEISKVNAISAADVLAAEELGGQLGIAKENLQEFAEITTGLDIATNMDVETAATELARFANITKMSANEYRSYANTIVELGNNFATTESEISSFAMRIASAGTQANMSQADILGISAAMSSLGLEAEAGGSAFSKTITEISTAAATGSSDLEGFAAVAGMSADEFAAAWRDDAASAFMAFVDGLASGKEVGSDVNVMLDELGISELRQSDALRRLAGNTELLQDAVKAANAEWSNGSALADEVANKNESLAAKMEMLKNRATAVAEEVGVPLANAMLEAADAAGPLMSAVESAANAFANMDEGGQRAITTIVGLAAVSSPALLITGKLVSATGSAVKAFGQKARAIGEVINLAKTDNAQLLERTAREGTFAQKVAISTNEMAKATAATKARTTASNAAATAATAEAAATSAITTSSKAATIASTALKGALSTIAPIAVITAVLTLGSALSSMFSTMKTNAENTNKATLGLTAAVNSYASAYASSVGSVDLATAAVASNARTAQEATASQAELATTLTEKWSEVGASAGLVDRYAETITTLANQTGLTIQQQAELKVAVDGINEATGSSISIIDGENGILSENADAIRNTAAAYIERAQAQAAEESLVEVYKEQMQVAIDLAAAEEQLASAQQNLDNCTDPSLWSQYSGAVDAARVSVETLKGNQESLNATEQQYLDIMSGAKSATDEATASSNNLSAALAAEGSAATQASTDIHDGVTNTMGTLPDELSQIGAESGSGFAQNLGATAPNAQSSGSAVATSANTGLGSLIGTAGGTGSSMGGTFASGVGSVSAYGEGQGVASSADSGMGSVSAYGTGLNFTSGFGGGISAGSVWTAAYNIGMSALNAIKSALGIASPSKEAYAVGEYFGQGAVLGMKSTEKDIAAESARMSDAMKIEPSKPRFGSITGGTVGAFGSTVANTYNFAAGSIVVKAEDIIQANTAADALAVLLKAKSHGQALAQ